MKGVINNKNTFITDGFKGIYVLHKPTASRFSTISYEKASQKAAEVTRRKNPLHGKRMSLRY